MLKLNCYSTKNICSLIKYKDIHLMHDNSLLCDQALCITPNQPVSLN